MTLRDFLANLNAPVKGVYYASGGRADFRGWTRPSPKEEWRRR